MSAVGSKASADSAANNFEDSVTISHKKQYKGKCYFGDEFFFEFTQDKVFKYDYYHNKIGVYAINEKSNDNSIEKLYSIILRNNRQTFLFTFDGENIRVYDADYKLQNECKFNSDISNVSIFPCERNYTILILASNALYCLTGAKLNKISKDDQKITFADTLANGYYIYQVGNTIYVHKLNENEPFKTLQIESFEIKRVYVLNLVQFCVLGYKNNTANLYSQIYEIQENGEILNSYWLIIDTKEQIGQIKSASHLSMPLSIIYCQNKIISAFESPSLNYYQQIKINGEIPESFYDIEVYRDSIIFFSTAEDGKTNHTVMRLIHGEYTIPLPYPLPSKQINRFPNLPPISPVTFNSLTGKLCFSEIIEQTELYQQPQLTPSIQQQPVEQQQTQHIQQQQPIEQQQQTQNIQQQQTQPIQQPQSQQITQPQVIQQPQQITQPQVIQQPQQIAQPQVIQQPQQITQPQVIQQQVSAGQIPLQKAQIEEALNRVIEELVKRMEPILKDRLDNIHNEISDDIKNYVRQMLTEIILGKEQNDIESIKTAKFNNAFDFDNFKKPNFDESGNISIKTSQNSPYIALSYDDQVFVMKIENNIEQMDMKQIKNLADVFVLRTKSQSIIAYVTASEIIFTDAGSKETLFTTKFSSGKKISNMKCSPSSDEIYYLIDDELCKARYQWRAESIKDFALMNDGTPIYMKTDGTITNGNQRIANIPRKANVFHFECIVNSVVVVYEIDSQLKITAAPLAGKISTNFTIMERFSSEHTIHVISSPLSSFVGVYTEMYDDTEFICFNVTPEGIKKYENTPNIGSELANLTLINPSVIEGNEKPVIIALSDGIGSDQSISIKGWIPEGVEFNEQQLKKPKSLPQNHKRKPVTTFKRQ